MSDKKPLGIDIIDDFELPPLPARPVKLAEEKVEKAPEVQESVVDKELPPLPAKTIDDSLSAINDLPDEKELPEADVGKVDEDEVDSIAADDDFELPPLPERKEEKEEEQEIEIEEPEEEPDDTDEVFDFEDDYDADLEKLAAEKIMLEDLTKSVAPIRSAKEESSRNMKEMMRMNDLSMDVGDAPVLDDLSDEYTAPKKKAETLTEKAKLEADEKLVLKQRLQEDLGRRPENFNARASKNMYNRLMEEKKLKIAKKGFLISLIPIAMGLIAAIISFFKMNWGTYNFFQYVAIFGVAASLLLFIKSKHAKIFGVIINVLTLVMYVGPGLVLYALNEKMQSQPDYIVHVVLAVVASVLNIASIIILTKNESVNTYYSTHFRKKK